MSSVKHGVELVVKSAGRSVKAVNTNWQVGKFPNQLPFISEDAGSLERNFRKFIYEKEHYARVGLLRDDILMGRKKEEGLARERCTEEQNNSRVFRCIRGNLNEAQKNLLPEDQWTPMDAEHCYLQHHLNDVINEKHERLVIKCATSDYDSDLERLTLTYFRLRYYFEIEAMKAKFAENVVSRKLV